MAETNTILSDLLSKGAATTADVDGRKLFLVTSENLGFRGERGLLIAMEGGGCFYWTEASRMNRFILAQKGFGAIEASTVLAIIDGLKMSGRSDPLLLEGPTGPIRKVRKRTSKKGHSA